MDTRRLSTLDVLAAGIINTPAPRTDIPEGRPRCEYDVYDNKPDRDALLVALERGDVLACSEYYGIPFVWKDGDLYRGTLLQYRAVTEAPEFGSADAAMEWFQDTSRAVAG
jgi:hypothetical protein